MGSSVFLAVKLKMADLLQLVKLFSRKRRAEETFLSLQYKVNEEMARKRFVTEADFAVLHLPYHLHPPCCFLCTQPLALS